MNTDEIIKALEQLLEVMLCEGDLQRSSTISRALDLIKRQQAEIGELNEKLKEKTTVHVYGGVAELIKEQQAEIEEQHQAILNALKRMGEIRAEAIKATEERLQAYKLHYGNLRMEIAREFADRLYDRAFRATINDGGIECYTKVVSASEIDDIVKEMEKEMEGDIRCPEEDSTI